MQEVLRKRLKAMILDHGAVRVDVQVLQGLQRVLHERLEALIVDLGGVRVDVQALQRLREVLHERLGVAVLRGEVEWPELGLLFGLDLGKRLGDGPRQLGVAVVRGLAGMA